MGKIRISIIGTGYVGLVTGIVFSKKGFETVCIDIDSEKIDKITNGISPFYEPGIEAALIESIESGNLVGSTEVTNQIIKSDIIFICVGTPSQDDGSTNLEFIKNVSKEIGQAIKQSEKYQLIVVKSTVPPGTTENAVKSIIEECSGKITGKDFGLCMNPEFLREGNALFDGFNPDRIIIGEFDTKSGDKLEELYADFNCPVLRYSIKTAELIKYSANSLLATKISFSNEIARICTKLGIDVYDVMEGVGSDNRINPKFLRAGIGFGGSCFPKDLAALTKLGHDLGLEIPVLESVNQTNKTQPNFLVSLIEKTVGSLENKVAAVLGLSFKPETDDVRETRALPLIRLLHAKKATIKVYDPVAIDNFKKINDIPVIYCKTIDEALLNADFVVFQTEWNEFKEIPLETFHQLLKTPLIFDGRRLFDYKKLREARIQYIGIGIGNLGD